MARPVVSINLRLRPDVAERVEIAAQVAGVSRNRFIAEVLDHEVTRTRSDGAPDWWAEWLGRDDGEQGRLLT